MFLMFPPESLKAHRARLAARGLTPRPAAFPAMPTYALFFNDPEQNLLELICHAPATFVPTIFLW